VAVAMLGHFRWFTSGSCFGGSGRSSPDFSWPNSAYVCQQFLHAYEINGLYFARRIHSQLLQFLA